MQLLSGLPAGSFDVWTAFRVAETQAAEPVHSSRRMLLFLGLAFFLSASCSTEMNQTSKILVEGGEQCSACDFREHSKQMRLHSIKSQILSILRLEQAPNISRDMIRQLLPKAPPLTQILDQYDPRVEEEEHATTETIITMATKLTTIFLQISHLKPGKEGNNTRVRVRSLKIEADTGAGSWQSIDIKSLLQAWLRQPESNYSIEINAFDSTGEDLAVTSAEPGEEGLFGWDWIIAPKRYRANYCSGECEFMHLQQYPHAHLVNKANPRGSAGPCCTPTKMSAINMLYFNRKEQIIYGKIPSMVVDHCGCS
ncbi:hypothetical protein F7725_008929 [Dissostichus mawsoni]|uniref:Growth/differentiation factor 8 n=1 Tax=Dissostichus mawsoni TaxID=36200 RepID=A0A7J5Z632_DISMA|nr:hypothetical protein F7725_008929 [Dissostichus mawsoni]